MTPLKVNTWKVSGAQDGQDEGVTCGEEQSLTKHGVKHGEQSDKGAGSWEAGLP